MKGAEIYKYKEKPIVNVSFKKCSAPRNCTFLKSKDGPELKGVALLQSRSLTVDLSAT